LGSFRPKQKKGGENRKKRKRKEFSANGVYSTGITEQFKRGFVWTAG